MKKYILLLFLLPTMLWAAENQSIIFTGTFSLNNVATDADSAWLHLAYYDTYIDSVNVTEENVAGGYYRYNHACTNDSVFGWSGVWIFCENTNGIRVATPATIALSMDSTDVENATDLDSLVQAIADANKPNFQSDGDTNQAQMATETDLDSVLQAIADANKPNFQSSGDTNQAQMATETDLDSVLQAIADANKPNFHSDGDTNTNPFDNATDSVLADVSAATPSLIVEIADSVRARLDSLALEASVTAVRDSMDEAAQVGGGSDSASQVRWVNFAVWGLHQDEDSSEASERWTAGGGGCSGTGAYSCTLWVKDTSASAYVAAVPITVNNQTETGTALVQNTNTDGYAVFSLDNGDYRASAISPPAVYAATDFTIASAVYKDSILGYLPTINPPSAAGMATVYGDFIVGNHDTLSNADVTFELVGVTAVIDTAADRIILPQVIKTTTNANGHIEIDLLINENLLVTSGSTAGHPWWGATIKHSLLTTPQRFRFFIDADSTTFNLSINDPDVIQPGNW